MGPNLDRERSSNRPPTSNRRLFGIRTAQVAGGLAIGGEVVRRVFPFQVAHAEASRAPSLQEFVDSTKVVATLTGLDETNVERVVNLRTHPSAPLALDLNPANSPEQRQTFANRAADSQRVNNLSAVDLIITSADEAETPAGVQMEPLIYPYKGVRTTLGFIGTGRIDDVATVIYAPPTRAEELFADDALRQDGLYRSLESAFAQAIARGGTSASQDNNAWDVLRQELAGMFMITPKARAEENPTGDRVRALAMSTDVVDSVSRIISRAAANCPYEFGIDPLHKESLAWWVNQKMIKNELEGNVNLVGLANPNPQHVHSIVVEGLNMGAAAANVGNLGSQAGLYLNYDESSPTPDIFWAPPPKIHFDSPFYMESLYSDLMGSFFGRVARGKNVVNPLSTAEKEEYREFRAKYLNAFIIRPKS